MQVEIKAIYGWLGGLLFTLFGLLVLGIAVGWMLWYPETSSRILILPFSLLSLNLLLAILLNPLFRRQLPLLIFHLALLSILLLVVAGRLTYLKGRAEVSEGSEFQGQLVSSETGIWHAGGISDLRFINEGFEINYIEGPRRTYTYNRVSWQDAEGKERTAVIGDQVPLILEGYRFYTTHNKGFAPTFRWYPDSDGGVLVGDVHLPPWPANELRQTLEWKPPGNPEPIWLFLSFDEVILDPDAPSRFRPPEQHVLVVREGESGERYELRPGEQVELDSGRLEYLGLRSWMGYRIYYDWTMPWMFAAAMVAVGALGWHIWVRYFSRPWIRK